ncbi:hypothetical protein CFB44_19915 [Burkholderia sp. AU31280]|nr:hypothetical protein CFB44_19915 [Burkholderia sp. AU31280]
MSRICIPIAERRASFARRVSVSLRQGETLGIVGESRSGKSTLAVALPGVVSSRSIGRASSGLPS